MRTKLDILKERNAKKYEFLTTARHYYNYYKKELANNGDTIKSRNNLYECLELYKYYFGELHGRCKCDYNEFITLYNYYKE